jgi:hypothetical protein
MVDASRKRAAVTHADHLVHPAFDRQLKKPAAGQTQRPQGHWTVVEFRRDDALFQPKLSLQFVFEMDASGDGGVDGDVNES